MGGDQSKWSVLRYQKEDSWGSNIDFGRGPNGQELASIEINYWVGVAPTLGKWRFDFAAVYYTYPGAFDPGGEFDNAEIWAGVGRKFLNDKLKLTIYTYWSPPNFSARPVKMKRSNSVTSGSSTRSGISAPH
jgi:hypothetical protein